MSPSILIYTRSEPPCAHCVRAKAYLNEKGWPYTEVNVDQPGFDKTELTTKIAPGAKTLPVVMINGMWIGGASELKEYINGNN